MHVSHDICVGFLITRLRIIMGHVKSKIAIIKHNISSNLSLLAFQFDGFDIYAPFISKSLLLSIIPLRTKSVILNDIRSDYNKL